MFNTYHGVVAVSGLAARNVLTAEQRKQMGLPQAQDELDYSVFEVQQRSERPSSPNPPHQLVIDPNSGSKSQDVLQQNDVTMFTNPAHMPYMSHDSNSISPRSSPRGSINNGSLRASSRSSLRGYLDSTNTSPRMSPRDYSTSQISPRINMPIPPPLAGSPPLVINRKFVAGPVTGGAAVAGGSDAVKDGRRRTINGVQFLAASSRSGAAAQAEKSSTPMRVPYIIGTATESGGGGGGGGSRSSVINAPARSPPPPPSSSVINAPARSPPPPPPSSVINAPARSPPPPPPLQPQIIAPLLQPSPSQSAVSAAKATSPRRTISSSPRHTQQHKAMSQRSSTSTANNGSNSMTQRPLLELPSASSLDSHSHRPPS